jgi:hypothetical protein
VRFLCPRILNNPLPGAPLPSHRRPAALNQRSISVPEHKTSSSIADLAAHGRTRTLALQKLHRICQAEVRTLKARYTLATVKLALSKYRERDPRREASPPSEGASM